MTRLFTKTVRPVGLPPGSLSHYIKSDQENIRLSIIEYGESHFVEKEDVSIDDCLEHLDTPSMTWIEVSHVSDPTVIAAIGEHFKFHSLVLEDILTKGQRSKLDVYQEQVFIVVPLLRYDDLTNQLKDEQISLVFGHNYLISFSENSNDIFKPIIERIKLGSNRIRTQGSDYLAYALLDLVVDYYFIILEKVDMTLDHLEENILNFAQPNTLQMIQKAKKEMIILRKAIWPMRDVINRFLRLEPPLVQATTLLYVHDVYDHTVQTIDIIEGFRDVVGGMMDIYLSSINSRTNEIMRVLTIVSTIFVPLTFITSLYGMNFEHMPELHMRWGYPIVLVGMLIIALSMLYIFYRKKWI